MITPATPRIACKHPKSGGARPWQFAVRAIANPRAKTLLAVSGKMCPDRRPCPVNTCFSPARTGAEHAIDLDRFSCMDGGNSWNRWSHSQGNEVSRNAFFWVLLPFKRSGQGLAWRPSPNGCERGPMVSGAPVRSPWLQAMQQLHPLARGLLSIRSFPPPSKGPRTGCQQSPFATGTRIVPGKGGTGARRDGRLFKRPENATMSIQYSHIISK